MEIVQGAVPPRPWWITEFGRGPRKDDYDYGLFIAQYGLHGLNAGAQAMLIWSLTDMYFPGEGGINPWGLWRYKDEGWRIRPVFYLYGLLTRFAGKGLAVQAVEGAAGGVQAAYLNGRPGATLIVANPGTSRDISLSGLPNGKTFRRYRYTEAAIRNAGEKPLGPEESVKVEGAIRDRLPERSVTIWTSIKE
jgi:hypothetical protein